LGKTLNAIFHLGSQAIYSLWWPNLTKDKQTEQLLCWSGITDTEHTASGSNEEDIKIVRLSIEHLR